MNQQLLQDIYLNVWGVVYTGDKFLCLHVMEIDLSQMFDYKIGSKGKMPLTEKIAAALIFTILKAVINAINKYSAYILFLQILMVHK